MKRDKTLFSNSILTDNAVGSQLHKAQQSLHEFAALFIGHSIHKRSAGSGGPIPEKSDFGEEHSYNAAKLIHNSTKANVIMHFCSIAILAVFVVEVSLTMRDRDTQCQRDTCRYYES